MTAALIGSATFAFADGGSGHVCDLGSAPAAGQVDDLCVNSNTIVATPPGFTAALTEVGGQGAYIFRRTATGGEGSTITHTTNGDHNTAVSWSRWGNINAADTTAATPAVGTGTVTPAHSTGALAAANELVIAFAALHSIPTGAPTAPSWSAGYTPLASAVQGTGPSGVAGFVAYRSDAGPAAEAPSVSWTNPAVDRYMLTSTFTTLTPNVDPLPGVLTAAGTGTTLAAAGATASTLTAAGTAVSLTASGTP